VLLVALAISTLWSLAPASVPAGAAAEERVLVGAGDIASCTGSGDSATAALVKGVAGTVFTTGDNAYGSGTAWQFANCYDPTWGVFRGRTRPSAGNHDYATAGAAPYYAYFGSLAGHPSRGYYRYDRLTWRIYVLNSNCSAVGGCGRGSPQERWLRRDLAEHPHACVLAYWHHPLFSSGEHGGSRSVKAFWDDLYAAGAEVVLNGHDHVYERFRPQTPAGIVSTRGIRQFTVGTGGRSHTTFPSVHPNSVVRNGTTYGVLKLTLRADTYVWRFLPEAGKTFSDSGSSRCH
jgi:hypothetical protein